MNILYYFPEKDSAMYQWQRIHFIDELNRYGINIYTFNPLLYDSWEEANEKFLKYAKERNYDLFFTSMCSPHMFFYDTLAEIKHMGLPTLSFRPDNLVIPYNDKELAPLFDLVWLTARETKYLYDKWKVKTIVAPYAANPYAFNYHECDIKKQVCFIGTPYGSRTRMMNILTRNGCELSVFYNKQPHKHASTNKGNPNMSIYNRGTRRKLSEGMRFKEGRKLLYAELLSRWGGKQEPFLHNNFLFEYPSVSVVEQSGIYSQYSLSLASTSTGFTDVLKKPLPIINLRNFEIPMSGGLEFCRYNSELSEYFEDGKEIVFYHTDDELVEKANYYLHKAPDSEIQRMKRAARKKAEHDHTWGKRFTLVFNALGITK